MKIAIFSDSHDHVELFKKAISQIQNTDALIHCGDLVAPSMLMLLCESYKKPIHLTFGNCDGDEYTMMDYISQGLGRHAKCYKPFGEIELAGKKIAFVHYPPLALGLASSEKYDAVFYGHNHTQSEEKIGRTLFVNPGTLAGMFSPKDGEKPATYAIYDTESNTVKFVEVE